MSWTGKTAVITGVARPTGIGAACASLLRNKGFNVIGIDNQQPSEDPHKPYPFLGWNSAVEFTALQQQQQQPQQQQPTRQRQSLCVFLQVDLSQPAAIQTIRTQLDLLGVKEVDVLVNNAGIADPYMPPLDTTQAATAAATAAERAARWSQYIAVNLSAPFLLSEALLPLMEKRGVQRPVGGSIIHVSSTRALQSEPHCEGYGAAKAGLLGLTHAQAASLSSKGIRVNAVLPGWIDTAEVKEGEGSSLRPEDHEWHWAGRVGVPDDVAKMVAFLAEDSTAGFITGQQFVVDGGITKRMTYPE